MALITFLSDWGLSDHYTAGLKARILGRHPAQPIIDLSHQVEPYSLQHASYLLKSLCWRFPAGTVHVVAVGTYKKNSAHYIAVKLGEQYFIGADNGLFTLLGIERPTAAVRLLPKEGKPEVASDLFAHAALFLATEKPIYELGPPVEQIERLIPRLPDAKPERIVGHVIHVDRFGNLITNIEREMVEGLMGERRLRINFRRERIEDISVTYNAVEEGDYLALYNGLDLLEIAINQGSAAQLLGMRVDSEVVVEFV